MSNLLQPRRPADVGITVALCFAVAVLEGFDIQAIGVAAPRLAPELGFAPKQMGWTFSISNIGIVVGRCSWRLARRLRRPQPVLMWAVAIFGIFTLATAVSGTFKDFKEKASGFADGASRLGASASQEAWREPPKKAFKLSARLVW